jgi:hypothetical protein
MAAPSHEENKAAKANQNSYNKGDDGLPSLLALPAIATRDHADVRYNARVKSLLGLEEKVRLYCIALLEFIHM